MKNKILLYSITLSALAAIYIGSFIFTPSYRSENKDSLLLKDFTVASAAKIELEDSFGMMTFTKIEENWFVLHNDQPYPARTSRIVNIIDLLHEVKTVRALALDADSAGALGLDEESRKTLTIYDENNRILHKVYIGNSSESESGDYVISDGKKSIFLTDLPIAEAINKDSSHWSQLRIYPIELNERDITGLQVNAFVPLNFTFTMYKTDNEEGINWKIHQFDEEIDQMQAKKIIGNFINLEAESFCTENIAAAEELLIYPNISIEMITTSGSQTLLNLSASSTEKIYFGKLEGHETIYRISPSTVAELFIVIESFYY